MKQIAIQLTNISKTYRLHHEKPTLVEKFIQTPNEQFHALNHVNLTVWKGERIGIIGPNGSGKTTLLKIITGITFPTIGTVKTTGRVVSMIDLGAGFHGDLNGYQNIFLNGMLLGMTKRQIEDRLGDIINFADIKQFIDAPLFTYSSGMRLRLGFAVAYYSDPDIFVIDEGISVGDQNFQNKTLIALEKLYKSKKTVVMTSHVDKIIRLAKKIYYMENGILRMYEGKNGK